MRSVVITGASSGIGEECALRMSALGWRVFAGVRRPQDGERLRAASTSNGRTPLVPLLIDVTGPDSIRAAAQQVEASLGAGGLDGLVNNAGVAYGAPLEVVPIEDLRRQLEVNVVGQVAVTQAFLPLLRKGRGRIVNMGSVSGRIAVPLLGPYSASKFALDALTSALRLELRPWGIHVAYLQPAGIATPIWRKALSVADNTTAKADPEALRLYEQRAERMRRMARRNATSGLPVGMVGKAVEHALTSPRPRRRYSVGAMARMIELLRILPEALRERIIFRES